MVRKQNRPLRILIVEDEIFVALDIEQALTAAGHEVIGIAADRKDALSLGGMCDFALIDLNLRDGRTGPLVAAELFAKFGVRSMFVTANPMQIGMPPNGALGYIRKPFKVAMLSTAVDWALGDGYTQPDNDLVTPFARDRLTNEKSG